MYCETGGNLRKSLSDWEYFAEQAKAAARRKDTFLNQAKDRLQSHCSSCARCGGGST